jgi:bifunctional UDP-N-acetylglucosamine pyrophosphorylase / glucosamine-1-phosphate N-acetyltransferase
VIRRFESCRPSFGLSSASPSGYQLASRPHISSVVVLAAGQGKRMKSDLPKVLHPVCGSPMLLHVLKAVEAVQADRVVVVVGHGHRQVEGFLPEGVSVALQDRQLGTGHAVLAAGSQILPGLFLVLCGDTPLITGESLRGFIADHVRSGAAATVLTMELDDPTGYGRVVRGVDGSVLHIVEHRDATPEELSITEVNSGMYILPAPLALRVLEKAGMDNDQGEIYLTDVIAGLRERGERVAASRISDATLALGVNSQEELAAAEGLMMARGDC